MPIVSIPNPSQRLEYLKTDRSYGLLTILGIESIANFIFAINYNFLKTLNLAHVPPHWIVCLSFSASYTGFIILWNYNALIKIFNIQEFKKKVNEWGEKI